MFTDFSFTSIRIIVQYNTIGKVYPITELTFTIIGIPHVHHIIIGVHIVANLRHTSPVEVWQHLVLMSPFMRETPDCIFIIVDKRSTIKHAALLSVVETYTETALEHIIGIVRISHSAEIRQRIVFLKAQQTLLPSNECIKYIHILTIAYTSTIC